MTGAPYESAAAPTSHSTTDPAEFNVVCRSKSNLPNRTDSNAALLPYSGAGENTLRSLALFLYLDHPTKSDVTSGKIAG